MKINSKYNLIFFSITFTVIFTSCDSPKKKDSRTGYVEKTSSNKTSSTGSDKKLVNSIKFSPVRLSEQIQVTANMSIKPNLRKARSDWNAIYSNCRIPSTDYNISDFEFLGVGNPKNLGSIIDSSSLLSRLSLNEDIFSPEELNAILNMGSVASCSRSTTRSLIINTILDGSLQFDTLGTDLKSLIESSFANKKNMIFKIQGWQKAELNTAWLLHYLETGDNQEKKAIYFKELMRPGNLIIAKAIYVKGFSLDIGSTSSLSIDIQKKLKSSKIVKFKKGDLNFKIGLKSNSDKVISVECLDDFMVYGYLLGVSLVQ